MDELPDLKSTEASKYLPKLLNDRLHLRSITTVMLIAYLIINIPLFVLGIFYIDSATKSYKYTIYKIDDFWDNYTSSNLKNKEIQLLATFSGIISITLSAFNIMNSAVMFKHVYKGGLKFRLEVINYLNLILQIIMLGYSVVPIARHPGFNFLNFAILPISAIILAHGAFLFVYLRRVVAIESDYLLSLHILNTHKQEYWAEYLSKNNVREMRRI
jgi:hypothetical protein